MVTHIAPARGSFIKGDNRIARVGDVNVRRHLETLTYRAQFCPNSVELSSRFFFENSRELRSTWVFVRAQVTVIILPVLHRICDHNGHWNKLHPAAQLIAGLEKFVIFPAARWTTSWRSVISRFHGYPTGWCWKKTARMHTRQIHLPNLQHRNLAAVAEWSKCRRKYSPRMAQLGRFFFSSVGDSSRREETIVWRWLRAHYDRQRFFSTCSLVVVFICGSLHPTRDKLLESRLRVFLFICLWFWWA